MREQGSIRLFRRGSSAELRLAALLVLAVGLLITDARYAVLEPVRQAVATVLYPFQRVMLAPRDLVTYFSSWTDAGCCCAVTMT